MVQCKHNRDLPGNVDMMKAFPEVGSKKANVVLNSLKVCLTESVFVPSLTVTYSNAINIFFGNVGSV